MTSIVFYFQVHQPFRIKPFTFFDIGHDPFYEDDYLNKQIFNKISNKCYLPANHLFERLIKHFGNQVKLTYSISGMALEQMKQYRPDVLTSFQNLVSSGNVELLAETYYHSLSSVFDDDEFEFQVKMHQNEIKNLFNYDAQSFRNTELIFSNQIAERVENLGFTATLCEGLKKITLQENENQVFRAKTKKGTLKVLPRNFKLTDDIAFRFSAKEWKEWPLTPEKYYNWLKTMAVEEQRESIHLFMDYETFGEHQWADTGIFDFIERLFGLIAVSDCMYLATVTEAASASKASSLIDSPQLTSWADTERDLSAWNQNSMQRDAIKKAYQLIKKIRLGNYSEDILKTAGKFLSSDHFYYMSTKHFNDGAVHQYFSPYNSPYDAYLYYTNALADFISRIN
ncbi:MAG: glycoside hydrolase family 57 protein [Cytophagales bacterium]